MRLHIGVIAALLFSLCWGPGHTGAGEPADDQASGQAPAAFTDRDLTLLEMLIEQTLEGADLPEDKRHLYGALLQRVRGTPPVPVEAADPDEVRARLRELLRARVAAAPTDRQRRLRLARFYLYEDDPEKALIHLLRIGPASENDIFWPLLTTYTYLRLGEHAKAADFLAKTREAAGRIVPLDVSHVVFTKRVEGLGQYEPRAPSFRAGEATWVYVELSGAAFARTEAGAYQLDINIDLAIRDHVQETKWEKAHYCTFPFTYQHRVHDVFGIMDFVIPGTLDAGDYTLVVTATDRESGQSATGVVELTITGRK